MSTDSELTDRWAYYFALGHAVQSGVAYDLERDAKSGTPKHLRTGLNLSKVEHGALVALLMAKGVFTEREYVEQLIVLAEQEVREYETKLTAHYGGRTQIKLR